MIEYTTEQMSDFCEYVQSRFRSSNTMIYHEKESSVLHLDVLALEDADPVLYATMGMGALPMNIEEESYQRAEVSIATSKKYTLGDPECLNIIGELKRIARYPFIDNAWLGPFHTINASNEMHEMFGYDYYMLLTPDNNIKVGDYNIHLYNLIPLYESEMKWILDNNTTGIDSAMAFFDYCCVLLGDDMYKLFIVDQKRKPMIPG